MSGIDLSQFLATFFEEANENLETLEAGLLELNPDQPLDLDLVNSIFRAAHTIKGGAGSFGLEAITTFTHTMETLLDELRSQTRDLTPVLVELLLEANDCLREMLQAEQAGESLDEARVAQMQQRLVDMRDEGAGDSVPGTSAAQAPASATAAQANSASMQPGWSIRFAPHPGMMHTGNDPLRILAELGELGELTCVADLSALPGWNELVPEDAYLSWQLELRGEVDREAVEEVFLWVEGDCELAITPLEAHQDTPDSESPGQATAPVAADPVPAALPGLPTTSTALSGEVIVERRRSGERRGTPGRRKTDGNDATSIRVSIDKIDNVINRVGELITTQSMLSNLTEKVDTTSPESLRSMVEHLREAVDQLKHHTRELQDNVMTMRMLPISFVFSRFGRTVHDLSNKLSKQVELRLCGESTELDKTVIEKIADPMMHLVRNSMDHGFERPEEREARGKPATGVLLLNAYHKGGNVYIEIVDDGRGLDAEKLKAKALEKGLLTPEQAQEMSEQEAFGLIMRAGFSTAEQVSDVSGRGVGMDVVRKNIEELNGEIQIDSTLGQGTTIRIRLPLTLAILEGQLVSVGEETYVVPLVSIIESMQVKGDMIHHMAGKGEVLRYRDQYLPILRLHRVFATAGGAENLEEGIVVVVEVDGRRMGVFVDDLLGQQQVAIKSLETNLHRVDGMMGATILGDGRVALILDPPGLSRMDSIVLQ